MANVRRPLSVLKHFQYDDSGDGGPESSERSAVTEAATMDDGGAPKEHTAGGSAAADHNAPSGQKRPADAETERRPPRPILRYEPRGASAAPARRSVPTAVVQPATGGGRLSAASDWTAKDDDDGHLSPARFRVDFMSAAEKYAARREAKELAKQEKRAKRKATTDEPDLECVRAEAQRQRDIEYEDLADNEAPMSADFAAGGRRDRTASWRGRKELSGAPPAVPKLAYDAAVSCDSPNTVARRHMDTVRQPFRPPVKSGPDENGMGGQGNGGSTSARGPLMRAAGSVAKAPVDERLKHFDQKLLEVVESEIMVHKLDVSWDEICGLHAAKEALREIVIWPFLRPELFHGVRTPSKGVLLFGPPGTGKTLIGKCVASQCGATFFNISASSLTSKWVGEGEKLVRALFALARCKAPSVVFIDEIDSLLSARCDAEHESSRRIKTEFLVQFDGLATGADERLLVLGATNRPHELDEAARRRFTKRLHVPLPGADARAMIVTRLLSPHAHSLAAEQFAAVGALTAGYSGADVRDLTREASYGPLRELSDIANVQPEQIRPISLGDFHSALNRVKPTVAEGDLKPYDDFDKMFGSNSNVL